MSDSLTQKQQDAADNSGVTFQLDADDPRRTDNRGGLEATQPTNEGAAGESSPAKDSIASDDGITGADVSKTGPTEAHNVGATVGSSQQGQMDMSTTGMVAPKFAPPGVGPVEGSQSGANAPQVEVTDIGLMDVNSTDVSVLAEPTAGEDDINA